MPKIHPAAYVDEDAVVIGEVELGAEVSIWPGAVLRGDVGPIAIGPRCNIQDGCVVHQTQGLSQTILTKEVTVGHGAILHGCRIHARVLIGMGAIIMDNAEIAPDCLVGAGSLVPPNKRFLEPGWLILGSPAKAVRKLTDAEKLSIRESAAHYVQYAADHLAT
ncbi:MAG: gamma carbonic anhydrase family protein [Planctomycetota bacterium]